MRGSSSKNKSTSGSSSSTYKCDYDEFCDWLPFDNQSRLDDHKKDHKEKKLLTQCPNLECPETFETPGGCQHHMTNKYGRVTYPSPRPKQFLRCRKCGSDRIPNKEFKYHDCHCTPGTKDLVSENWKY